MAKSKNEKLGVKKREDEILAQIDGGIGFIFDNKRERAEAKKLFRKVWAVYRAYESGALERNTMKRFELGLAIIEKLARQNGSVDPNMTIGEGITQLAKKRGPIPDKKTVKRRADPAAHFIR